tara:strand:- start:3250 stop:6381 length:3132 start_codon:yes stop_codon:yes gene_type:complete
MKIVHIADIHWRGLSRHDEYRESFSHFFKTCKGLNPDIIYVGGDIVHSKTQGISPELIDSLAWWFEGMVSICPVHVILGNHDGLMLNKDRQDAISPIISALGNKDIHLYKKSGVYKIDNSNFNLCVFSCFDEEGWSAVEPVDGDINIALFHGAVWGSKTDIDWEIEGDVTLELFDDFDFAMLGDIHKRQFLNEKKTMGYCGSSIQQNYGETPDKGFLFWDIRDKDDFDVEFHRIYHKNPFITIEWRGNVNDTLCVASKYSNHSRFRIKSDKIITQAAMHEISMRLKESMNSAEVVFKNESQFDSQSYISNSTDENSQNLRDIKSQYQLFDSFFENYDIEDHASDEIKSLIDKYLSTISQKEEVLRNSRWQIDSIDFDNLFSYGKNNHVDFKNNPGITGIFGKNTRGKSSIVGAIMYGLFNTTDRGSIKNEHIINSRENYCSASIDLTLNGEKLRIKRKTVKHTTRKGETYATTGLDLEKIDENGETIENLTEEQRRETEKILRKLIGTSDDFLMTSLANQGGMNRFLSEGATSRKAILTKFLDLEIFEKMYDMCREDSALIKSLMKSISHKDWNTEIEKLESKKQDCISDLTLAENKISSLRDIRDNLRKIQITGGEEDTVTQKEIDEKRSNISDFRKKITSLESTNLVNESTIKRKKEKILSIEEVCNITSLDDLKSQEEAVQDLEKTVIMIKNELNNSNNNLDRIKKSAERLDRVPCEDMFPSCMFIKESYKNKEKIQEQTDMISKTSSLLSQTLDHLSHLSNLNPSEKIKKYNALILKMDTLTVDISRIDVEISSVNQDIILLQGSLEANVKDLDIMLSKTIDTDPKSVTVSSKIKDISQKIDEVDKNRISIVESIALIKVNINNLKDECDRFEEIKAQMKIYDLFLQASSKKGIPTRIMMSRLPVINSEIVKILQGVVEFTVSLRADTDSNAMDIYIDYGDSSRIIELASGMEKMIASLAIRVALINTSSLTKTNMMIIDEGFGALDVANLESCTNLLESLKKWFRNIIVISHVDAIKDCVDNLIEIEKRGKNSYANHR